MGSPLRKEHKRLPLSPPVFTSLSLSTEGNYTLTYDLSAPLCSEFDVLLHQKKPINRICSRRQQNRTWATLWLACALRSSNAKQTVQPGHLHTLECWGSHRCHNACSSGICRSDLWTVLQGAGKRMQCLLFTVVLLSHTINSFFLNYQNSMGRVPWSAPLKTEDSETYGLALCSRHLQTYKRYLDALAVADSAL